jgi:hypothetical protein
MSVEFKLLSVYANVQFPDNVSKYFFRIYIKYVNEVLYGTGRSYDLRITILEVRFTRYDF